MSGDDLEAVAHTRYEWDCPSCGVANDEGDIDPQGSSEECGSCGASVYIRETR